MANVRYIVKDVSDSVAFYTAHLNFDLVAQYGPAMAILQREDLTLWVAGSASTASKPMPDGSKPEPGGWSRFVILVQDIEKLVAELRPEGVKFRNEIETGPGGKQILCEDPSGNVIELFQPS